MEAAAEGPEPIHIHRSYAPKRRSRRLSGRRPELGAAGHADAKGMVASYLSFGRAREGIAREKHTSMSKAGCKRGPVS